MISKYYLSSHNPEAQKPFCMVRMEWLPDHDLISGNGPQFTSTVTKVAEECRVLPTHNQQLWQQYSKRESGMINQQWKQQRTSSGKPWIPERPRTLRFSSIATPKEWSQALYNRTSQTDWERLTKKYSSPDIATKALVTCPLLQKAMSCDWNPFNEELRCGRKA